MRRGLGNAWNWGRSLIIERDRGKGGCGARKQNVGLGGGGWRRRWLGVAIGWGVCWVWRGKRDGRMWLWSSWEGL